MGSFIYVVVVEVVGDDTGLLTSSIITNNFNNNYTSASSMGWYAGKNHVLFSLARLVCSTMTTSPLGVP